VTRPSFRRERALIKRGVWPIAGCDEARARAAGRPVVAAPWCSIPIAFRKASTIPSGSRERREELFEEICATSAFSVAVASRRESIATILRASLWALARSVHALPRCQNTSSSTAATGSHPLRLRGRWIGGDGLVLSIAAASIIAQR